MGPSKNLVSFTETDGCIRFETADLADQFKSIAHKWPSVSGSTEQTLFAELSQKDAKTCLKVFEPTPSENTFDLVNSLCQLVVELNWSRLRHRPDLICLHAAGVVVKGQLILILGGRRAGKSTLTAELSRLGHAVFSDDILAVEVDALGGLNGLAAGIAPRLRLPLPPEANTEFGDWVEKDPGLSNKQYKYLFSAGISDFGTALPIAAVFSLDRQDTDVETEILPQDIGEVLPLLIHQNFGRFSHSGRTLASLAALAKDVPCRVLRYRKFADAAKMLERWVAEHGAQFRAARIARDFESLPEFSGAEGPLILDGRYIQTDGAHLIETSSGLMIADSFGLGIFHMNGGMVPIWQLLQEPITCAEIAEVLAEVFPDQSQGKLEIDVKTALGQLYDARLIKPVDI